MNITIVGAGNGGTTVAADLTLKGHSVNLLKTSNSLHNEHFDELLRTQTVILSDENGKHTVKLNMVTTDYSKALNKDTELIIIYIQTNYVCDLLKKLSEFVFDGQMLLFEPGYLSTAYAMQYINKDIICIEAESSPIDCRITSPGQCSVLFKNVRNPIGVYPFEKTDEVLEKLKVLKYNFTPAKGVIDAALNNPNLIVHTIGAIMSIPRIEYSNGEYWMYKEVFTESIWNLVEKLDAEKMQILKHLGIEPVKYVDACKFRNNVDLSLNSKEVFFDYAQNHSPKGPNVSNSRYITEDVPEGLCFMESLGETLNIPTPVTTGLINIASACLNMDFRLNGRNIKQLKKENLDKIIQNML